jgi:DNA-binding NarL/FixJ family response regulator
MLRRGHSTSAIARRLKIAPVTVRRHISELVHKLGVEDRAALVRANDSPNNGEGAIRSGSPRNT